jgi:hypothetical protein
MRTVFSRQGSPDVFLYAFDVLKPDGRDLRSERWDTRRTAQHRRLLGKGCIREQRVHPNSSGRRIIVTAAGYAALGYGPGAA